MLRNVSLSSIGLSVGALLSILGIYAYATNSASLSLAGLFYGVPILLGGAALKSSEVRPVAFLRPTTEALLKVRNEQATPIQKQLRQDVTRYRYGIKAHLDEVLEKLGVSRIDEERPVLVGIYEELVGDGAAGNYSLVLRFASPLISWETWQDKQEKCTQFFGPGVLASVSQPEPHVIDLHLTRNLG